MTYFLIPKGIKIPLTPRIWLIIALYAPQISKWTFCIGEHI